MIKRLEQMFHKNTCAKYQWAHGKMFNHTLIIREMWKKQWNITHQIAKIKKSDNPKYIWGYGTTGILIHSWWEVQSFWETFWQFLEKLSLYLPYVSEGLLLEIFPNNSKYLFSKRFVWECSQQFHLWYPPNGYNLSFH